MSHSVFSVFAAALILGTTLVCPVSGEKSTVKDESFCDKEKGCDPDADLDLSKLTEVELIDKLYHQAITYDVTFEGFKKLHAIVDRVYEVQSKDEGYLPRRKSFEDQIEKLNKWANENYEINGVKGEYVPGIGLGMVASKDIKTDDTLMKIPVQKVISTQQSSDRFECMGNVFYDDAQYKGLWRSLNLSIFLLSEMGNKKSEFRPYLDALPGIFTHPIHFNFENFVLLNKSVAFESSAFTFCETVAMYSLTYLRLVERKKCPKKLKLPLEKFTLKSFQWAYSVALSRNYDGSFHDDEVNKVLIPFWDLANHDDSQAVETSNDAIGPKSDKSNGEYLLYAERDIKKGEPIYMHYLRPLDPIEAFSTWGFVFVKSYLLTVRLDENDPLYEQKRKQLKSAQDWREGLALPDPKLLNGSRLLDFHNKKAIRVLLQIANGDKEAEYTPKKITKAWQFLLDQLESKMKSYDLSIEEVTERLSKEEDENTEFILRELQGEMEVLGRLIEYVKVVLDS